MHFDAIRTVSQRIKGILGNIFKGTNLSFSSPRPSEMDETRVWEEVETRKGPRSSRGEAGMVSLKFAGRTGQDLERAT